MVLAALSVTLLAVLGMTGVAEAATPVATANGEGVVSYNGERTNFTLSLTGNDDGTASGSCEFVGAAGTRITCTSFFNFRVDAPNRITTYGTALFNGRPISFSAVVTDGGTGSQDTYTLYAAGRVIGGRLISGNVSIQTGGSENPQAQVQ